MQLAPDYQYLEAPINSIFDQLFIPSSLTGQLPTYKRLRVISSNYHDDPDADSLDYRLFDILDSLDAIYSRSQRIIANDPGPLTLLYLPQDIMNVFSLAIDLGWTHPIATAINTHNLLDEDYDELHLALSTLDPLTFQIWSTNPDLTPTDAQSLKNSIN